MRLVVPGLLCLLLASSAGAHTVPLKIDAPEAAGVAGAPRNEIVVTTPRSGSSGSLLSSCAETLPYFRRMTTCAISGNYSLWAGVTESEATALNYLAGQGCGNNWNIPMARSFNYGASWENLELEFDCAIESEPGYDYFFVEIDWPGSAGPTIVTGYSGVIPTTHYTHTLYAGSHFPPDAATLSIRFVAKTDGGWSDEDGLYPSECGLAAVDNIRLTAVTSNTTLGFSDFEAGDDGWAIVPIPTMNCGPPDNFTAVAQCTSIQLNWSPVPEAYAYNIYRDGVHLASVTGTSRVDLNPGPGERCYQVRAFFLGEGYGPFSAALCRTAIGQPPTTTNPSSLAVSPGHPASFSVSATGAGLSFQWRKNTTAIPGATLDHFDLASAQVGDAGDYDVIVTNACGSDTSAAATLTVQAGAENPNSAVILERVFNDCPISTLTTTNNYPALVSITDANPLCFGYANLHVWRFSSDGLNPILFANNASYSFSADLTISGTGEAEAGLQVAPWWSQADGRFNCRTTDGEIACYGGRLPFYSFTTSHGLVYVRGTTVHLEMIYRPNGLSAASPATMEYRYTDASGLYSSGPLPFDEANPAEDPPHGLWGQLNEAGLGGHFQYLLDGDSAPHSATVSWAAIDYANTPATPAHTITATSGSGGLITPSGAVPVGSGADQSFTMTADPCHHVADVLVDGVSVGAISTFTFSAVAADHTISATFAADQVAITLQPVARVACSGSSVSFTTAADGTPTPTFQWRKGGVIIPGATASTLALSAIGAGDAGSYDVIVSSPCGADTSNAALLTVASPPTLSLQPVSRTVCTGAPVTFVVTATGTPPLTFRWRRNGVLIGGATAPSYTIGAATAAHAGSYDVLVGNMCDTLTSAAASLTVNQAPLISPQPGSSMRVALGQSAVLVSGATGTPPLTLRWYRNSSPLVSGGRFTGAEGPQLTISNVGYADEGWYRLAATNACGQAGSMWVWLDVVPCANPPVITLQPVNQATPLGGAATFTVAATACVTPTFTWYRSINGAPWTSVTGATQASFTIPSVTAGDRGRYICVVSTEGQSSASTIVSLNIVDPFITYFSAQRAGYNGCSQVQLSWYTSVPTTGVISYGDACDNLSNQTAATPLSNFGSVLIDRPPSGQLTYRLTATMASLAEAQSECRTWVFPGGYSWPSITVIANPQYVQRVNPDDGINVGLSIRNPACGDVMGPIEVVYARLAGAYPRDLENVVTLPRTIRTTNLVAGETHTMEEEFSFARSEVGAPPGATVYFYAVIRFPTGATTSTSSVYTAVKLP